MRSGSVAIRQALAIAMTVLLGVAVLLVISGRMLYGPRSTHRAA